MLEIRWHGRAGQGVFTAGELLGEVAVEMGKFFQSFQDGAEERMGSPATSHVRISDVPIEIHSPILEPDMVIVTNPDLVGMIDFADGIQPSGTLIINTPEQPAVIRQRLGYYHGDLWCIDASRIAMEELRRDIPGRMMLGVMARATDVLDLDDMIQLMQKTLNGKVRPEVIEANVNSLRRAYAECVHGQVVME
jgi:pyruvate ferredoxin oxidoreductase gamma subunit